MSKIHRYSLILIPLFFISSCSENKSVDIEIPLTSEVEKLVNHSKEFERKVTTYETPGGKIHFAIGYGIANSIMVEGIDGNIIIDTADSVYEAEQIYKIFRKKNSNPIKAIIYTHNHGDHTFGAAFYNTIQSEKPIIIAHEDTDYYMQRILGIINPIISERSTRMFGTIIDEDDFINVGIGASLNVGKSVAGYVKPNQTFKDQLNLSIAGIDIELHHAPGETNDQLFVWLPKHKALMPGDNVYKTFPNLYTIRGTTHRDVIGWINSIDQMRALNADYIFPSHTLPILGADISPTLTIYRDGIQYVHDQTIRLMNKGFYPNEIVEMIELPENIRNSPFLYEFYGTVRWSVRSIFNGYLGWFSGNPTDLDPLTNKEEAIRFAKIVGGNDPLFIALEEAVKNSDMQWALELSDRLLILEYKLDEVNNLRKQALTYLGKRSSNPNKRNYFLTSAIELNSDFKGFPKAERNEDLMKQISLDTIFKILSVSYDPTKHDNSVYKVCFNFLSGTNKTITLRNQIAAISENDFEDCNLSVEADDFDFKKVLGGIQSPVGSMADGSINIEGSNTAFLNFLLKFR
jgi:alkyl sulfatase BDS1-like metallo-beta-lactamase superfamily hydrolase